MLVAGQRPVRAGGLADRPSGIERGMVWPPDFAAARAAPGRGPSTHSATWRRRAAHLGESRVLTGWLAAPTHRLPQLRADFAKHSSASRLRAASSRPTSGGQRRPARPLSRPARHQRVIGSPRSGPADRASPPASDTRVACASKECYPASAVQPRPRTMTGRVDAIPEGLLGLGPPRGLAPLRATRSGKGPRAYRLRPGGGRPTPRAVAGGHDSARHPTPDCNRR